MTTHTFLGYGINAPNVTVVIGRITHWFQIDYNGRWGTEIVLDTGKSIRVDHYPSEVEKIVLASKEKSLCLDPQSEKKQPGCRCADCLG